MAAKRAPRRPIALSHGVKDPPTSKAIRQLEGVARGLQGAVSDLQNAPATAGVQSITAGSSKVTASPTTGAVVVDVVPANFPVFSAAAQGVVPASGGGTANFLRSDGLWVPPGGSGGGGLYAPFLSAVPTQASTGLTSWLVQTSGATATDGVAGLAVFGPNNNLSTKLSLLTRAAPSAPYTITALIAVHSAVQTGSAQGAFGIFGWSDGTKFQVYSFGPTAPSTGNNWLQIVNYANSTTNSSTPWFMPGTTGGGAFVWLRLRDDGTSVYWDYSVTGEDWLTTKVTTKSAGYLGSLGYTNVVFGTSAYGEDTIAKLLSWSIT